MPALGGDPLDPDLGGRIASFSPRARRRRSPSPAGGGHRSLNPNVIPPGLRPGGREGEPQARRCRSRVSVQSSASGPVRRSAGSTRRVPSCASSSWAGGRGSGSAMPVLGGSVGTGHRRTYRQLLAETPVTEPQRHSPRSTTGGPGGRAAGEAMPFPRQRSVVGLWAGAQVGRLDPSGAIMRKLVVGGRSRRRLCDAGPWRRSVGTGPRRTYRQLLAEGTPPKVAITGRRRTPVTEPQRHSPRSTTGGSGGRAAGEAMPFPRQRSVVGLWAGAQVGRLDPSGAIMRKLVVGGRSRQRLCDAGPWRLRWNRTSADVPPASRRDTGH